MKKAVLFLASALALFISSCTPQNPVAGGNEKTEIAPEKNEDGEWDLEVLDTNFNYFLNAVAKPIDMYSEIFLRSKNIQLVSEWNSYYYSGKYRNIIESSISYDPQENYGKNFDYKLYQVFVFVRWKYGLRMKGLGVTE